MLRPGGRLAFLTIQPTPGLDPAARRRANRSGPSGVAVPTSYESLLHTAGFVDVVATDLTAEYRDTQQRWIDAMARRETALRDLSGDLLYEERQEERATTLAALDAGILARFRYTASRPSRSSGRRRRSLSGTLS